MPAPKNLFKARLKNKDCQIGLWIGLADPNVAELCSGTGFDWLVIDAEHGPNSLRDVLAQIRAIGSSNQTEGSKSQAVVRVRDDNRAEIKQMLDIGAQTILVPMIDTAEQAQEVVKSMHYPPLGVRGVGAALARASKYAAIPDYLNTANDEVCLLIQIESVKGVKNLDEILKLEGIDGVFVGPSDLAADMGFVGKPGADEVREVVRDVLTRIRASGKAAGILTSDQKLAKTYQEMNVEFLAVGSDVGVLRSALLQLRANF